MKLLPPKEWLKSDFELIIDARSPAEYTHSHIINSHNLYVLNDAEHQEVGTLYKHNKLEAKILGARYACMNIANFLPYIKNIIKPYSKIGIYCARGGQRSESMGIVLSQIGYEVCKMQGGYKEYRNHIIDKFENDFQSFNLSFISLCGNTGVGKSRLLALLEDSVDLEGMARHYGSVFGVVAGVQPSQKYFDDMLYDRFVKLNKNGVKHPFIEAESRKIGKILLGKSVYEAMSGAFRVWCECSMEQRVARCVEDYKNIKKEVFYACLDRLKPYLGSLIVGKLDIAYQNANFEDIAYILLNDYYDKVYKKPEKINFKVDLDDLNKAAQILQSLQKELDKKL